MEDQSGLKDLFLAIGIDAKVVESTLKNKKLSQRLKEVVDTAGIKEASKTVGNLFYGVASKVPESLVGRTKLLTEYITAGKILKP